MKNKYTLEELRKIFEDHAVNAIKNNRKQIAKWREYFPDADLPEHFKDDFILPYGLLSIVDEIIKLKKSKNI